MNQDVNNKNFTIALSLVDLLTGELIPDIKPSIGKFVMRHLRASTELDINYESQQPLNKTDYYSKIKNKQLEYTKINFSQCKMNSPNMFLDKNNEKEYILYDMLGLQNFLCPEVTRVKD